MVNGLVLSGAPSTDGAGNFRVILNTAGASAGWYSILLTVNPTAGALFWLDPAEPLRAQADSGPEIAIPAGLGFGHRLQLTALGR